MWQYYRNNSTLTVSPPSRQSPDSSLLHKDAKFEAFIFISKLCVSLLPSLTTTPPHEQFHFPMLNEFLNLFIQATKSIFGEVWKVGNKKENIIFFNAPRGRKPGENAGCSETCLLSPSWGEMSPKYGLWSQTWGAANCGVDHAPRILGSICNKTFNPLILVKTTK